MSKIVVNLFQSATEAERVKQELVRAGYSANNMRVVTNNETSAAAASGAGTSTTTEGGFGATISNFFKSLTGGDEADEGHFTEGLQKGGALLSATVADGQERQVADLLENYGGQEVDGQPVRATSPVGKTASPAVSEGGSVPIVQEEMTVGKRQVQRGGVRVYSHLVETPVEQNIQLHEEHVRVDRQAANRPAGEADFAAFKEGTIELTETAEEAVVSKNARVVEEITVGKQSSESTQTIRDSVRHTEVEVEQLASKAAPASSYSDSDFRNHFAANYGTTGKQYEAYAPAYRYGQTLGSDPRYTSSNWSAVEANAQKDWASKGTGKWEDFKGAVQQGWNKTRDTVSSKN